MKNVLICICVLGLLLTLFSCPMDEEVKDIVSFKLDGELIELTKGYTAYENIPLLTIDEEIDKADLPEIYVIRIFAFDEGVDEENPANEAVIIQLFSHELLRTKAVKTYTDPYVIYTNVEEDLYSGCEGGDPPMTVTLETLGEVGEYCTGTFSGSVRISETEQLLTITEGVFNVLRYEIPEYVVK